MQRSISGLQNKCCSGITTLPLKIMTVKAFVAIVIDNVEYGKEQFIKCDISKSQDNIIIKLHYLHDMLLLHVELIGYSCFIYV